MMVAMVIMMVAMVIMMVVNGNYHGGDGDYDGEYDVTASRFPSGENSTASKASPRLCGDRIHIFTMILKNVHNSFSFLFMYHDS